MSRLHVALDGRPLQSEPLGGVGRYLAGLLPHLTRHVDLSVLVDRHLALPTLVDDTVEVVALGGSRRLPGLAWLEAAVAPWLRRSGALLHGTFNTLPLTFFGRSVLTVYDLAPQLHAEDFSTPTQIAWRTCVRASVKRAEVITTVSEFSQRQIAGYFSRDPREIPVVPCAVSAVFGPDRSGRATALARSLGLPVPYVVAVGGAPRRGLATALDAWRRARAQLGLDIGLVVLSERGLAPEPGLVSTGPLDDEDWATLLAGARALCYPTRYEGFGLPGLEALASGTPVICERVASLPEVLGEAACWSTSSDPSGYADVVVRLLTDRVWQQHQRDAGLDRVRTATTWAQSAGRMIEAYERAAG
jgi:glycosyltransferase involved in cell wall biosynthesis